MRRIWTLSFFSGKNLVGMLKPKKEKKLLSDSISQSRNKRASGDRPNVTFQLPSAICNNEEENVKSRFNNSIGKEKGKFFFFLAFCVSPLQ